MSYFLQVIDASTGEVATSFNPARPSETEFIDTLVERVQTKQIGFFVSESAVLGKVREAVEELLLDLKKRVKPAAV